METLIVDYLFLGINSVSYYETYYTFMTSDLRYGGTVIRVVVVQGEIKQGGREDLILLSSDAAMGKVRTCTWTGN